MMKESQGEDRMRRPPFMPDKDAKQNDTCADERGLHQSDLSLTEVDKCPHQTAAAGAGEKRTGKIESADTVTDALVHSGDHEQPGDTRDSPCATGRAQRPAAFVRRVNNSEQNKRKSGNGSSSHALDGARADK